MVHKAPAAVTDRAQTATSISPLRRGEKELLAWSPVYLRYSRSIRGVVALSRGCLSATFRAEVLIWAMSQRRLSSDAMWEKNLVQAYYFLMNSLKFDKIPPSPLRRNKRCVTCRKGRGLAPPIKRLLVGCSALHWVLWRRKVISHHRNWYALPLAATVYF